MKAVFTAYLPSIQSLLPLWLSFWSVMELPSLVADLEQLRAILLTCPDANRSVPVGVHQLARLQVRCWQASDLNVTAAKIEQGADLVGDVLMPSLVATATAGTGAETALSHG
jgi:hypothetical protein